MCRVIRRAECTGGSEARSAASLAIHPRWLCISKRRPHGWAEAKEFGTPATEPWSTISAEGFYGSDSATLLDRNGNVSSVEDRCRKNPEQHGLQNRYDCCEPVDRPIGAEAETQEVHQDRQPRQPQ